MVVPETILAPSDGTDEGTGASRRSQAKLLAAGTGGVGVGVGAVVLGVATGHPMMELSILLLIPPASIILYGAATGIAQGLQIGLRARLLRLLDVDDPEQPGA
jgi:hypothetical protein